MKTSILLPIKLFFLVIVLCSCNDSEEKTAKKMEYSKKTSVGMSIKQTIKMIEKQSSVFAGRFVTTYNNSEIIVDINENQNAVSGIFILNNEKFQVKATSDKNTFFGRISELSTGRFYEVSAEMRTAVLHLFITFPELNNQIVELQLNKEAAPIKVTTEVYNQKEKSQKLIGTWRYTEVLSSGYGGSYGSMATDYFIQFKSNGECISWTGKSAGGTNNSSMESNFNSNVDRAQWYTVGKNVVFFNPANNKEITIPFFAEENRMMLKGNLNRVYTRVN